MLLRIMYGSRNVLVDSYGKESKRKEGSTMGLYDLKIDGRVNPVGTSFLRLVCSWKVRN